MSDLEYILYRIKKSGEYNMPKHVFTTIHNSNKAAVFKMDFGRYMVQLNGRTMPPIFVHASNAKDYAFGLVWEASKIGKREYRYGSM